RAQVRALAMTGMPVQLLAYGQHVMLDDELCDEAKRVSYLAGISCTHTAIAIKQLVPFSPQTLRDTLCPPGIRNYVSSEQVARIFGSTIFYTSWERDRCHPEYVELFNTLGQVWVPCKDNATAFISSGVDPERVKIVPCPYDPEDATIAAPRGEILPPVISKKVRDKRFYNIGKWEPRKNQHQLIGAFLQAHTPKDRASLLIKTSSFGYGSWANYPTAEQSVQHWLDDEQVKAQGWTKAHFDRLVRIVEKKISEE